MAYSSIIKPSDYFNTKLYTGNSSTNAQTGVGFQPDWTWIKTRNAAGYNHVAVDAVRGVTKEIRPNTSAAEITTTNSFTSFDSDGFTLGADSGDNYNKTGNTYASWNWKASGTSGSSNTDGSITSTVSASTTSGFSIVKYNGTGANATVGHGLGVAPKMIIVKNLDNGSGYEWIIGQSDLASGGTGFSANWYFNGFATGARNQNANASWNSTSPTNSVFSLHSGATYMNASGEANIAYCFAEKKGFSKFGSYTGNGNADGPMIYTGFKPTFIMLKNASAVQDWQMYTFDMQPFNEFCTTSAGRLKPNTTDAQSTKSAFDMLSNGFKMRTNASDINASGNEIIYMAFAEAPFVANVDGGLPTTAR